MSVQLREWTERKTSYIHQIGTIIAGIFLRFEFSNDCHENWRFVGCDVELVMIG
ncbi:hypothetical protein [Legionella lansingensis]|uniref:hypothetical protein n=1 Tax=Legionella lansingensis TaxID=45067 RepID=UPI000B26B173|nr:hypothetical protein [Legionella lansingensis]